MDSMNINRCSEEWLTRKSLVNPISEFRKHGKACTIAISEWKRNDKNYVDREDRLNCFTIGTYVGEDDVNAAENNAWRGKTARILRPNGRYPIRDNETKTDKLKSIFNREGFEDVNTLEMQQDRTTKVLGLAAMEVFFRYTCHFCRSSLIVGLKQVVYWLAP